ncbi:MAG: TlpA disulfide reductase family protein [Ilumatobacter sp.]|uniref:TlpA family protein disulfide reductase n=1 Tax=Ilumatobacter sp. TaxID=1967498 RepID=UPI00261B9F51|nr:TlpA disulfide reductase family protein [Ilumatobacter sp.]MDJ0771150.1 TlpA disulfide reductase family protein [Ilumatobacter sp.]
MAEVDVPLGEAVDGETADQGDARGRRLAPVVAAAVAVVCGALFWILLVADDQPNQTASTPLLDRPAPAASGVLDDGRPFELSRRKGSWVVLNFFTHDCVPCIREHPELVRFVEQQDALGLDGAEFYSVVRDSTREEIEAFFAERGGDWPIVYDDRFEFVNGFGVALVPETWIIDPSGLVRGRVISEVEADFLSTRIQALREAGL